MSCNASMKSAGTPKCCSTAAARNDGIPHPRHPRSEDGTTAADIKARAEGSAPKVKGEAAAEEPTPETDESEGSDEYSVEEAGEKADEE